MRRIVNINKDWRFRKEEGDSEQMINLPHTWNAIDGQDGGNDYFRGICQYSKELPMPDKEENEKIWLEFKGVAMSAKVVVNGKTVCVHEGGYSTFRVEVTEEFEEQNEIKIFVDNEKNQHVYPQKADFTFYGGIYRDVNLIFTKESHFALVPSGTPGIKVTPSLLGEDARVMVETFVTGEAQKAVVTILETGEEKVCEVVEGKAKAELTISGVHKWQGREDPYLYTVRAKLYKKGESVDEVEARFGCREFSFDSENGFYLNGKPYPLRGVSRHQDRQGVGNALTQEMHREDMKLIREIGANTVRLAHYQHDQYFYDLCDEYGIVVWAEIPYITKHMKGGDKNTLRQMEELVTQCYNHPSIICWGLSNEITAGGAADEAVLDNHRALNQLCHELDKTRPTTLASVFMLEPESPINQIPDILSYNLYFGWYIGELSQNEQWFDEFHEKFPNKIIGFSEYGADANVQYQSAEPKRGDYSEQYQCIYHEHILRMIEERPFIWASHVWNMFDFAADGRDEGGTHGVNQKGLVSFDRRIKKDAFYMYKAHWSNEPFIHICGRRYIDRVGDSTEVIVYSNQDKVTLLVDGRAVEEQRGHQKFVFKISINDSHNIKAMSGALVDEIRIQRVEKANQTYQFVGAKVTNWFEQEEYDSNYYSINDTLGEIRKNQVGARMIDQMIAKASASRGDVAESTKGNKNLQQMMNQMTVVSLLKQAGDAVPTEQIKTLNNALQKIKKE